MEGNKGNRIAVFRDSSIDPTALPPVFDDYQVIIRYNDLTNNNTIGSRCFSALSIGADPANANAAQAYPETGIYRVEANRIDTAGACPYSGQFNNGIALLGGASNNLIAGNSIKGGDAGIWLNSVSATTANLITGNVLCDSNYGIRMTGNARNNTVEKSTISNIKYVGVLLVGNSSQGVFVEGNIFKENELSNNRWNNIRMDYGVKDNHFYNNIFK